MLKLTRRSFLLLLLALGACAQLPSGIGTQPPVIFVHGNGDSASAWHTTVWRFESNGYDRTTRFWAMGRWGRYCTSTAYRLTPVLMS